MGSISMLLQLCISLFIVAQTVAVPIGDTDDTLQIRQADASATAVTCLEYSSIANLSTIGLNATLRAAYLQLAPDGTDHSVAILNTAEKKLPPLTTDAVLNQQCGNLTTVALVEASNNFTNGIVAQYRVNGSSRRQGPLSGVVFVCFLTLVMAIVL